MALSDERIDDLAQNYGLDWLDYEPFARAIEAEVRKELQAEIAELRRGAHALAQINCAQNELLDAMNVSK